MPTFPKHYGPPLPDRLDPLNPRHYLMLLNWVFFRPSFLKHFVRKAVPEQIDKHGVRSCLAILRHPPCRDMFIISGVLSALFLSPPIIAAISTGRFSALMFFIVGPLVGLIGAAIYGVIGATTVWSGCSSSILGSVSFLVAYFPTYGLSNLVILFLPRGEDWIVLIFLTIWLAFPLGMAISRLSRIDFSNTLSTVSYLTILIITTILIINALLSFAILRLPASSGEETDIHLTPVLTTIIIIPFILPAVWGWLVSILAQTGFSILVEAPWSLWLALRGPNASAQALTTHPVRWDESMMVPAPRLAFLLKCSLITDETLGLLQIRRVAANPYQRWAAQRAVCDYAATTTDPLKFMYRVLRDPRLDEYVIRPVTARQQDRFLTARAVVLGEWSHEFIDGTQGLVSPSEWIAYILTRLLRRRQVTPLSQFAGFACQFLDDGRVESKHLDLQQHEPILADIRSYPHGEEIYCSFVTLATILEAKDTEGIAGSLECLDWTDTLLEPPLRPEIVDALRALGDVSGEVAQFHRSTSRANQAMALNRAAGALEEMDAYVREKTHPPERALLTRVVRQWQTIIAKAQGQLGEETLREITPKVRRAAGIAERRATIWHRPTTPLSNPYKAGDPVYPPLFTSRKDVFDRIGEVWSDKENPDSIILYGHRRMGKTSILRNLDQHAPPGSVLVYMDMKGETSFVQSTADLLLSLAEGIHSHACRALEDFSVSPPNPEEYRSPAQAQFCLDRFLRQVQTTLGKHQLILALDEFEAIEDAVQGERIGKGIYQYLRSKTQEPWLTIVFAGLHTLDEMSREYQEPFYGSYVNIRVSYLSREAAGRLITNPTSDFQVDYDSDVVDRIIEETRGQPMLVQHICQELINHLNYELFDLNREREVRINLEDLSAVLTDEFISSETRYFDGVWSQVQDDPDQVAVLTAMAQRVTAWTIDGFVEATGLEDRSLRHALRQLNRRDILAPLDDAPEQWHFLVPLMRRWITLTRT